MAIGAADFAFFDLRLYSFKRIPLRQHLRDMINLAVAVPVVKFQYHGIAFPAVNAGVSRQVLCRILTVLPEVGLSVFFDILFLILRVVVIPELGPLGSTCFAHPMPDPQKPVFPGEVFDSLLGETLGASTV